MELRIRICSRGGGVSRAVYAGDGLGNKIMKGSTDLLQERRRESGVRAGMQQKEQLEIARNGH